VFDDDAAALTPRSGSSFEDEPRRLLESFVPVTCGPAEVSCEPAEAFRWHRESTG
jgi:hypothetical protein